MRIDKGNCNWEQFRRKYLIAPIYISTEYLFIIMIGILVLMALILVWQFIAPILLAFAVVVIMKPIYNKLLGKGWIKGRELRSMGIVFWIAGVPYLLFFTLISMSHALEPYIGISLVAWPVGIFLLLIGNIVQGIFVVVFILIVADIDTVMRPHLVPKEAYPNPGLVILSVFVGQGYRFEDLGR